MVDGRELVRLVCRPGGCSAAAMDGAAANGHLDIVRWLHEHRSEGCTSDAMDAAGANGHLYVVRWIYYNRGEKYYGYGLHKAVGDGHSGVLDFLTRIYPDNKCELKSTKEAANQNQFEVLAWLEQHDPELALQVVPEMQRRMDQLLQEYTNEDVVLDILDYDEAAQSNESDDE